MGKASAPRLARCSRSGHISCVTGACSARHCSRSSSRPAATLAVPLAVRRMIDLGFSGVDPSLIDKYFITLVGVGLVLAVASAARFYCVNWLGERVVADIRRDVFKHLTGLSPAFYEVSHSGEVMSRLTADTTQIKAAASTVISQALRNAAAPDRRDGDDGGDEPQALAGCGPRHSGHHAAARRLRALGQGAVAPGAGHAGAGVSLCERESRAKSGCCRPSRTRRRPAARFGEAVERSFAAANARAKSRAGLTAIAIFLVFASVVGVLWYGAQDVLAGTMTGGRLGQFVLYALLAAAPVGELSEVWGEISQAAGAAERLSELLAGPVGDQITGSSEGSCPTRRAARSRSPMSPSPIRCGPKQTRSSASSFRVNARRADCPGRAIGRRQDDDLRASASLLRSRRRRGRD